MGNLTTRTNNMNQEFRRRLVKQISVFVQENSKYTLTLPRVERMLSLFPLNLYFSPVFGGNEFISHNPRARLAWGEALPGITQY